MRTRRHPAPLEENAGLAFAGARVFPGLIIGSAAAERMLGASNRHGKPNADVLRPYVGAEEVGELFSGGAACPQDALGCVRVIGRVRDNAPHLGDAPSVWVVDFPADTTPEEASLYAEPWRIFRRARGVLHARSDPLRIAIARLDTYLAAPLGRAVRGFARIESATLPGPELCVVASDDDFVAALLQSGVFAAWVRAHGGRLRVRHVASFPFPWPPRTGRSELTRAQIELRDNVLRASEDDLDDAVAAAYGWRDIEDETDVAARLKALQGRRS